MAHGSFQVVANLHKPGSASEMWRPGKFRNLTRKYVICNETETFVDPEIGIVGALVKGCLSARDVNSGRELIRYKSATDNRPDASGVSRTDTINGREYRRGGKIMSSMVGFASRSNFHPDRVTAMTARHLPHFIRRIEPLMRSITKIFRRHAPEEFKRQRAFIKSVPPEFVIPGTVFTTGTVNVDVRTAAHRDTGDFGGGLAALAVFNYDSERIWTGGQLLLIEYNLAFNLEEGDVLFIHPKALHCNGRLQGSGRMSLVCYAQGGFGNR